MQQHTSLEEPGFRELELAAWTSKAAAYEHWFAPITRKTIAPILRALAHDLGQKRFLDVCTGTGNLAGAAARLGARVTGIDFAASMIEIARANYPGVAFDLADAETLPFPDQTFDCVANAFGISHLPHPERAFAEALRVLRPEGRLVYTTWLSPEDGFDLSAIVNDAVREHGSSDVKLPPAPPPFRFAEEKEALRVLQEIGCRPVECERKMVVWHTRDSADVIDLIFKSIVRAPMLIERQAPERRERIKEALRERAESLRSSDVIELRFPYLLVAATRSS